MNTYQDDENDWFDDNIPDDSLPWSDDLDSDQIWDSDFDINEVWDDNAPNSY